MMDFNDVGWIKLTSEFFTSTLSLGAFVKLRCSAGHLAWDLHDHSIFRPDGKGDVAAFLKVAIKH